MFNNNGPPWGAGQPGGFAALQDYLNAARPAMSNMLGLTPQQRVNQGFGAQAASGNGPMVDFNQSFGMQPFGTPQDQQALLAKYLQPGGPPTGNVPLPPPRPADAGVSSTDSQGLPPGYGAGPYGGSPATNPNLRPVGNPYPWQGKPFASLLDAFAEQGGQPGAGLIPKFVNLIGRMS